MGGYQAESIVSKLIMLIVVFATAWWLLKRYLRDLREDAPPVVPPEDMVCCARCGIHLPRSESVLRDDRHFCNTEHACRDE